MTSTVQARGIHCNPTPRFESIMRRFLLFALLITAPAFA
jgi:hypothetical protein